MSKYDDQVVVTAKPDQFLLQVVNDSKSAYSEVVFMNEFFIDYECPTQFECRIDIKSFLMVFRVVNLGTGSIIVCDNINFYIFSDR